MSKVAIVTGSARGSKLLKSWAHASEKIVRVIPTEYRMCGRSRR